MREDRAQGPETSLTERQLLMWLEHQLFPLVPSSNMLATFRISADVDPDRFRRAFRSVVERSDALRTVFDSAGGAPRQRVLPEIDAETEILDVSTSPDPAASFRAWSDDRRQRLFRLDERAFDSVLVRVGPEESVWYLCLHHLIVDGWSFSLVYQRTLEAYLGAAPAELDAFAVYVEESARRRGGEAHARSEAFWRRRTSARLPPVQFYGRSVARRTPYFDRRTVTLDERRTAGLRRLAPSEASLWGAITALVFAYVHRVSGNRQIGVGSPLVNRTKRFRDTIGPFIEVCPLRVEIADGETFASLRAKTKDELFAVLPHAAHCTANPSNGRAFEVMVNFHNSRFPSLLGPTRTELTTGTTGLADGSPRCAEGLDSAEGESLVVNVDDFGGTGDLTLSFDFNLDVFDESTREVAPGHFLRMLDAFVADPDRAIDSVDLRFADGSLWVDRSTEPAAVATPGRSDPDDVLAERSTRREHEAPANDREMQLAAIWQELLGVARVGRHDDFFALGGHSLLAVRLLGRIHRSFGVQLSAGTLFERPTIAGLAGALSESRAVGPALVPLRAHGNAPPIFFLCGIKIYHALAERLGARQPSYGIFLAAEDTLFGAQAAGSEGHLTVPALAAGYVDVIRARQPRGPYRLAGVSFGGILAFEVAQRLRRLGERVELLALMDSVLPRARRRWWSTRPLARLRALLSRDGALRGLARRWMRAAAPAPVPADDAARDEHELAELREMMYARAMDAYDPQIRPYPGPMLLFRALDRVRSETTAVEPTCGWGELVTGGLEVVDVPGDHLGILRAPAVDHLATAFRARLDALGPSAPERCS